MKVAVIKRRRTEAKQIVWLDAAGKVKMRLWGSLLADFRDVFSHWLFVTDAAVQFSSGVNSLSVIRYARKYLLAQLLRQQLQTPFLVIAAGADPGDVVLKLTVSDAYLLTGIFLEIGVGEERLHSVQVLMGDLHHLLS